MVCCATHCAVTALQKSYGFGLAAGCGVLGCGSSTLIVVRIRSQAGRAFVSALSGPKRVNTTSRCPTTTQNISAAPGSPSREAVILTPSPLRPEISVVAGARLGVAPICSNCFSVALMYGSTKTLRASASCSGVLIGVRKTKTRICASLSARPNVICWASALLVSLKVQLAGYEKLKPSLLNCFASLGAVWADADDPQISKRVASPNNFCDDFIMASWKFFT